MSAKSIIKSVLPPAIGGALSLAVAAKRTGADASPHSSSWRRAARTLHLDLLPPNLFQDGGLLVDVGGHEGAWAAAALRLLPRCSVAVVEPSPASAENLRARFSPERVTVHEVAISNEEGTAKLHRFSGSNFDSLFRISHQFTYWYGEIHEKSSVEVAVATLDSLFVDQRIDLLKIDVQGAEREVIRGGQKTLRQTGAVMIEMNFVSHYEGDHLFHELHLDLVEAGLRLHQIAPGYLDPTGRLLWADAIYARDT